MNFTKLTKEEQLTILANVAEEKGIVDNAVEKDYLGLYGVACHIFFAVCSNFCFQRRNKP